MGMKKNLKSLVSAKNLQRSPCYDGFRTKEYNKPHGGNDHNQEEKTMQFINDYTHFQIMKTETELKENTVHVGQGNAEKTITASLK